MKSVGEAAEFVPGAVQGAGLFRRQSRRARYDIRMVTAYVLQNKKSRPPKKSKDGKQNSRGTTFVGKLPKAYLTV